MGNSKSTISAFTIRNLTRKNIFVLNVSSRPVQYLLEEFGIDVSGLKIANTNSKSGAFLRKTSVLYPGKAEVVFHSYGLTHLFFFSLEENRLYVSYRYARIDQIIEYNGQEPNKIEIPNEGYISRLMEDIDTRKL